MVYRYFCLSAHYRTQMSFSWESLESSQIALNRMYQMAYEWGEPGSIIPAFQDRFMSCINDDLNMPRALAVAWDLTRSDADPSDKKATILDFDEIFGLDIATWAPDELEIPDEILRLVQDREVARQDKNWPRADEIRNLLLAKGYVIEDTKDGARVRKSS